MSEASPMRRGPLIAAGTTLGIGLGGFLDGILLHQVLQLHNMLSAKYPVTGLDADQLVVHLEVNMFWDGLFHGFCWLATVIGLALLWRAGGRPDVPRSTPMLLGSLVLGWGLFNLVEGLLDHHILHIHHVVEQPNHALWDWSFLGASVVLVAIGVAVIGTAKPAVGESQRASK